MAIGFTVLAAVFAGGGISGGAYNPAVGTALILINTILGNGSFSNIWIYWIGPILGGITAAFAYKFYAVENES